MEPLRQVRGRPPGGATLSRGSNQPPEQQDIHQLLTVLLQIRDDFRWVHRDDLEERDQFEKHEAEKLKTQREVRPDGAR